MDGEEYNREKDGVMSPVKDAMREISEKLPDEATWDDAMEAVVFRRKYELAMEDVRNGRTVPMEEAFQQLLKKQ